MGKNMSSICIKKYMNVRCPEIKSRSSGSEEGDAAGFSMYCGKELA